jgi:nitrogenase-stabilizing/protective protein
MSDFLADLAGLSSAEEFFDFLKVPYDPAVVRVNRLHILKRFHDYIGQAGLPEAAQSNELGSTYAKALDHAYSDFLHSNGVTEKVFQVFQKADAARKGSFVPLTAIVRKPS